MGDYRALMEQARRLVRERGWSTAVADDAADAARQAFAEEIDSLREQHRGAVNEIAVLELALRDMADDCWPAQSASTMRRYIEGAATALARAGAVVMAESDSPEQVRIDLAFRRLQIALLRAGFPFDGQQLESAATAAAKIVERRVNDDDRLPPCEDEGRKHWWTVWRSNPFNAMREERFCFECGAMEWQSLTPPSDASDQEGKRA